MTRPARSRDVRAARQEAADRDLFFMAQAFGHGTDMPDEDEAPEEPEEERQADA